MTSTPVNNLTISTKRKAKPNQRKYYIGVEEYKTLIFWKTKLLKKLERFKKHYNQMFKMFLKRKEDFLMCNWFSDWKKCFSLLVKKVFWESQKNIFKLKNNFWRKKTLDFQENILYETKKLFVSRTFLICFNCNLILSYLFDRLFLLRKTNQLLELKY